MIWLTEQDIDDRRIAEAEDAREGDNGRAEEELDRAEDAYLDWIEGGHR